MMASLEEEEDRDMGGKWMNCSDNGHNGSGLD